MEEFLNLFGSMLTIGAGFSMFFMILMLVLVFGILIFSCIVDWKLFEKAGKPGWAAIVPIYNKIVLLDIIGYKWYYVFGYLLSGIPVVGSLLFLAFDFFISVKFAKSFKQEIPFGIGLCLVPIVFRSILVFDKNINYVGKTVNGDIDFKDLF